MPDSLVQIGKPAAAAPPPPAAGRPRRGRPDWLRIQLATPAQYHQVRRLVDGLNLHTVCEEARCPNIYECWGEHGTATFMILGDVCTRRCGFCAVTSGRPAPGVDADEPRHVAEAVAAMGLRHAVVTSVDRDDLPDGGAGHFAAVIEAIHRPSPGTAVEVLTPDFRGVADALDVVLGAGPEVFSHNVETVPRMYRQARPGSRYERSLGPPRRGRPPPRRRRLPGRIKTGLMAGIGETRAELEATLRDVRGRRGRDPDPRPVPPAHPAAPARRPLGPPRGVRRLPRAGPLARLRALRGRAAGSQQLPRPRARPPGGGARGARPAGEPPGAPRPPRLLTPTGPFLGPKFARLGHLGPDRHRLLPISLYAVPKLSLVGTQIDVSSGHGGW